MRYTTRNSEIKSASQYIDTYKYLVRANDDAPDDIECPFFREWKDKAFYSLLFVIFGSDIDPVEKGRMVTLLESYVVRRSICGLTNKSYNKITLEILKKEKEVDYETLHDFLCSQSSDTARFPNDDKINRDILHAKFYNGQHNIQRYILEHIEKFLRTSQDEEIKFDGLTLDHIMPQTRDAKDKWATFPEQELTLNDYIHTIGNITLLPKSKNTSKKNYSYDKIRGKFLDSSLLMNREIGNSERWNLDSIQDRSEKIGMLICERWPYNIHES